MDLKSFYCFVIIVFLWSGCASSVSNDVLQAPVEKASLTKNDAPDDLLNDERFYKNVLVDDLFEPTEFEILADGKVLFIQRRGEVMLLDPEKDELTEVAKLDVHTKFEDGLMGLALDPNYEDNHWIYLYYSVPSSNPNSDQEDYVPTREESKQHLSRFVYKDGVLDLDSEILMLEVQTQRVECCHTGGSIEFGPDGNLFLSTGDNVNPFASDGFGPFDEQPGRSPWDGQTTSANTNDLRGKILRITPQPDGTYSIPEGNLFPIGTEKTRPEIYVMGNRNPYRISIDQKTGYLYWGEVGPDANEDSPNRGPRGHDEVNQARQAGNYGWPLFVADNKAYVDYNFASQESGDPHDASAPINDSPNNTGLRELPPAQKAFIWYPYAESSEFPMLGSGGRNAMAGPVFYKDAYTEGAHSFPAEFDGRLFIYDWIRGWIMTVTMDENSDLVKIDPFMPTTEFSNPIDMQFDKEGVLYVMEYGKGWFSQNKDARISRIEYRPVKGGQAGVEVAEAIAENNAPEVAIDLQGNQSFYFGDEVRTYSVHVSDAEDGSLEGGELNEEDVLVQIDYLPTGHDKTLIAQGHQMADEAYNRSRKGKDIMDNSDCAGCHAVDRQSIGPTYKQVAEKYADDPDASEYLKDKIKNGGGGVWGEQAMAAHPQLTDEELEAIVGYILSVIDNEANNDVLGAAGEIALNEHLGSEGNMGTYYLRASYTDKGVDGRNAKASEIIVKLRHPQVEAESFEGSERVVSVKDGMTIYSDSYLVLKNVDLTGINSLTHFVKRADKESVGGDIEVRLGSPEGVLIGQAKMSSLTDEGRAVELSIEETQGMHDVYLIANNDATSETNLFILDWVMFNK